MRHAKAMQCVAGPISHQSCCQVALQQTKSCKASKIKKRGDGDGVTMPIRSLYLAVTSDCSSQVLTVERIMGCVHRHMQCYLAGHPGTNRQTPRYLALVSAQASSMKKNLRCASHSAAMRRAVLSTWLLGAYKSLTDTCKSLASYSPPATKVLG